VFCKNCFATPIKGSLEKKACLNFTFKTTLFMLRAELIMDKVMPGPKPKVCPAEIKKIIIIGCLKRHLCTF